LSKIVTKGGERQNFAGEFEEEGEGSKIRKKQPRRGEDGFQGDRGQLAGNE
jgi:hypothetical protein